ncbi:hypothetical protein M3Y94_00473700 [Aphelenchoides besseyi]|nr:hypothetical protein M3Y94_00473700 [Aphelenchoides besseyi]KAI6219947.1 hypothetical protein M3Y95_01081500 [Aphelenchoides besseyi]
MVVGNFTEKCPEVADLDTAMGDAIDAIANRLSAIERSTVCWLVKEATTEIDCSTTTVSPTRVKRETFAVNRVEESNYNLCEVFVLVPAFWVILLVGLVVLVGCAFSIGYVRGNRRGLNTKMLINLSTYLCLMLGIFVATI